MTDSVPPHEAGFALVTAVIAMVLFALLALTMLDSARGTALSARAAIVHARLDAAADAGLAIAVANLDTPDRSRRWSIDGRRRRASFDGTDLVIAVEDERGKIPINQITDEQARAMFEAAGADGTRLDTMTDSFLDWRDDDDEVREYGAEADYYARLGIRPRNGALRSIDELRAIRGIDAVTVERLRPLIAVYSDQRDGFDDRYALPIALAVMSGDGLGSPAVIEREREAAGQRTAIELADGESLVGRPLDIVVEARREGGARLVRTTGHRAYRATGAALCRPSPPLGRAATGARSPRCCC